MQNEKFEFPKNIIDRSWVLDTSIKTPYVVANGVLPVVSPKQEEIAQEIKNGIENLIVQKCIDVDIDPDILKKQAAELLRQAIIIQKYESMIAKGLLVRRPCPIGAKVYIKEGGKTYEATVIRYEYCLRPNRINEELLFVDLHVHGLDVIVKRHPLDFGKTIFTSLDEAAKKDNR